MEKGNVKREIAPQRKKREAWSDEKVAIICKEIAAGKTYEQAYTKARVSKTPFYEHMKNDKNFKDAVKIAEQEFNEYFDANVVSLCKRSLTELITGYEYDEITTESYINAKTQKRITRTKKTHKRVAPNTTAVIFALCNRDPDHWKNRIDTEVNAKVEQETKTELNLKEIPDELLNQVLEIVYGNK